MRREDSSDLYQRYQPSMLSLYDCDILQQKAPEQPAHVHPHLHFFSQHNSVDIGIDCCKMHQILCTAGEESLQERLCINSPSNCNSISSSLCLGMRARN